jgi:hypothetical protein
MLTVSHSLRTRETAPVAAVLCRAFVLYRCVPVCGTAVGVRFFSRASAGFWGADCVLFVEEFVRAEFVVG